MPEPLPSSTPSVLWGLCSPQQSGRFEASQAPSAPSGSGFPLALGSSSQHRHTQAHMPPPPPRSLQSPVRGRLDRKLQEKGTPQLLTLNRSKGRGRHGQGSAGVSAITLFFPQQQGPQGTHGGGQVGRTWAARSVPSPAAHPLPSWWGPPSMRPVRVCGGLSFEEPYEIHTFSTPHVLLLCHTRTLWART